MILSVPILCALSGRLALGCSSGSLVLALLLLCWPSTVALAQYDFLNTYLPIADRESHVPARRGTKRPSPGGRVLPQQALGQQHRSSSDAAKHPTFVQQANRPYPHHHFGQQPCPHCRTSVYRDTRLTAFQDDSITPPRLQTQPETEPQPPGVRRPAEPQPQPDAAPPAAQPAPAPQPADSGGLGGGDGAGQVGNLGGGLGATAGASPSTPAMIGDLLNGSSGTVITLTESSSLRVRGTTLSGVPGTATAVVGFDTLAPGDDGTIGAIPGPGNDFTTIIGTGTDASGDGPLDTFSIAEPVPPTDAPTAPSGFDYDGGTAVYTNDIASEEPADGVFADGEIWLAEYSFSQTMVVPIETGGPGGAIVSRVKLSENNSPLPQDRVFFNYNFFNNAIGGLGDVSRYTVGLEKTCWCGDSSLELRLPFAATSDNVQFADGGSMRDFEWGNLMLISKHVLLRSRSGMVTGGMGLSLPTGPDFRLFRDDNVQTIALKNEGVHLLPFVGAYWTPNRRSYIESFLIVDVDANGNTVRGDIEGGDLPRIGKFQDPTLLEFDIAAGYWVYQHPCCPGIRGIAPTIELHYTTTLNDADVVSANKITVTSLTRRFDILNLTGGVHFQVGRRLTITPAMSIPLRRDDDRAFDYEVAVLANWNYGALNRGMFGRNRRF